MIPIEHKKRKKTYHVLMEIERTIHRMHHTLGNFKQLYI